MKRTILEASTFTPSLKRRPSVTLVSSFPAATLSFDDPKKQATYEAAGVADLKGHIEELKVRVLPN